MTTHRFREIAQELREQIALGGLDGTGALESEAALGSRHGVSRVTVRRALELLRSEGLIEPRRGSGWFVVGSSYHQRLAVGTFTHAGSAVAGAGRQASRRVVDLGIEPLPTVEAGVLGVDAGERALRCRSVRSIDGQVLDVTAEWVPDDLAGPISRSRAETPGIWATLQAEGLRVARVHQSITAGLVRAEEAELLQAEVGSPLLLVRRVARDDAGRPLALADHRYLAHRFSLEVDFAGAPPTTRPEPPGLLALPGST